LTSKFLVRLLSNVGDLDTPVKHRNTKRLDDQDHNDSTLVQCNNQRPPVGTIQAGAPCCWCDRGKETQNWGTRPNPVQLEDAYGVRTVSCFKERKHYCGEIWLRRMGAGKRRDQPWGKETWVLTQYGRGLSLCQTSGMYGTKSTLFAKSTESSVEDLAESSSRPV